MDRATHSAILQKLALPLSAWPHFQAIAQLFGVSFDTVFSIYSQEVQSRVLRRNHVVKAAMAGHAQRWLAGKLLGGYRRSRAIGRSQRRRRQRRRCRTAAAACTPRPARSHHTTHNIPSHAAFDRFPHLQPGVDALQLAFELDFPPCVLLRRLLEHLQLGLPRERVTRALRHPDQLPTLVSPDALQQLAGAVLAAQGCGSGSSSSSSSVGGSSIGGEAAAGADFSCRDKGSGGRAADDMAQRLLQRLQQDVEACVLCDRVYSPASGGCMATDSNMLWRQQQQAQQQLGGLATAAAAGSAAVGACWPVQT